MIYCMINFPIRQILNNTPITYLENLKSIHLNVLLG